MSAVRLAAAAAATAVPVVWDFLGYHFQAGPTIVGVCAVIITRMIVFLNTSGRKQIILDAAVSALCILVTCLWVQANDLDLLAAGITGIGIATTGIGLLSMAKGQVGAAFKTGALAALRALAGGNSPSS